MKLRHLITQLEILKVSGNLDQEISGISYDSRKISPGDLFVAWQGTYSDGISFVEEALSRGVVAFCLENEWKGASSTTDSIPRVRVKDARSSLADLAKAFYRNPTQALQTIGVTGTNGKTTVSFLIESILRSSGIRCGLLGTVLYKIDERFMVADRTTPESLDIQKFAHDMVNSGCSSLVMEVSSHALEQGRVRGINFDAALFTNLTQDHLDYHKNFENYFRAKARLFENLKRDAVAVINEDDFYGKRLSHLTSGRIVSYGFSPERMVWARNIVLNSEKSVFEIVFPEGVIKLSLSILGRFNVTNALAAFAGTWALGVDPEKIKEGLEALDQVPGRMQFVPIPLPFQVMVDYAHTEDALKNVLSTLRPLVKGRLITVFGCGGDRDSDKRPKMGRVAALFSDQVVITSDNPRSEDPSFIALQIEEGVKEYQKPFKRILDRREAIEFAMSEAQEGDLILIAGKGHEKFQETGRVRIPFDDVVVAEQTVQSLKFSAPSKPTKASRNKEPE
ncbi:MAG: UDP-N-acetylmuramoyl-L-alanyl-D-glutamate--2,6-diaminopimelate ligase [Chlamydiae bacterium]|nr:UDP-N-acetylmuramoyl-L-alanyl-D-glutamate--2,6-diaminopimelate ligase [Chlamydiota bacterium]MBI3276898.1 UDP-N-acetylmuramoyl-L-alanyl-D-glutamate--2,6-diaminopimelate ligase [Chlamydiota bacterium]